MITYRPLLERIGRQKLLGKRSLSTQPGNGYLSKDNKGSGDGVPLRARSDNTSYGFRRLENDACFDSGITVTTNIEVGEKTGQVPKVSMVGEP